MYVFIGIDTSLCTYHFVYAVYAKLTCLYVLVGIILSLYHCVCVCIADFYFFPYFYLVLNLSSLYSRENQALASTQQVLLLLIFWTTVDPLRKKELFKDILENS